jgi:hypothetical protein
MFLFRAVTVVQAGRQAGGGKFAAAFGHEYTNHAAEKPDFPTQKTKGAPQGAPFALLDGDTGGANAARDHCE